jgi:hypothetical protein
MSDTADTATVELPDEISAELKDIEKTTKRGFDPKARMRNRGLRRGTITLFLDEELGPKLGWAHDLVNQLGEIVGRGREGKIGELEVAQNTLEAWLNGGRGAVETLKSMTKAAADKHHKELVAAVTALQAECDTLMAEMNASALIINMRAVPPVIQKDCRRKAKALLKIASKNVPDDLEEAFQEAQTAFLMTVIFQSVTDTESGGVNEETTYDDAIEYARYLPPGQFDRLDMAMGKIQFTDAISREIEGQEDFS